MSLKSNEVGLPRPEVWVLGDIDSKFKFVEQNRHSFYFKAIVKVQESCIITVLVYAVFCRVVMSHLAQPEAQGVHRHNDIYIIFVVLG